MKVGVQVDSIMSTNLIKLNVTDTLAKAEQLFRENKIRHIPVMDGSQIIGMLSYTDLLRISFAETIDDEDQIIDVTVYEVFTIEQVMAKKLVYIRPDTLIKEAAEILATREFHALPVVENGLLVGIVTTTDLIKYLLNCIEEAC
ncbi:MAG: CBS domain-containing protein [Flavobacteriaceae bacterium]